MAVALSTAVRNAQLDEITAAAGANALLSLYDGTRPATGGTITTLLAQLVCASTFAAVASGGVLTLNAISDDPAANATGTATWFRLTTSGGTFVMDGNVGTSGSDLNLSTVSIVANARIQISAATITRANA